MHQRLWWDLRQSIGTLKTLPSSITVIVPLLLLQIALELLGAE